MTPTEVLKMLKSKIDTAGLNKCNYAIETSDIEAINQALLLYDVSGSVLSDEEMREPIENALYATKRFLTTQATDLAEGILEYLKDAGFTIVRTDR